MYSWVGKERLSLLGSKIKNEERQRARSKSLKEKLKKRDFPQKDERETRGTENIN